MTKTNTPGKYLVCGTNSFKPICREYSFQGGTYTMDKEKPGQALCPYDPQHNSTAVFVDGDLYTGTVADFSGTDPIIYREPLQTEQYDSMSLNAPNFVSSMTMGDFVFFFFRETAVEYINCGKGEFPFHFNEIQSTTELIEGVYGTQNAQVIYAVFTTPPNSISGSAVCAFSFQDISDTFEGAFKEQAALNANWLPVQSIKVPDPRPGQCVNDSRTLPDLTLNFIKTHSLMDESVPSFFGEPIVIRTIDPQIKTPGGKAYDVLFIGTDNGKVIKAVNADSADTTKHVNPVVIEEIQVFPPNVPIRNLKVVRETRGSVQNGRLIVVSDQEVQSLSLHRCYSDKILSCSECVALQDPYCAWDKQNQKCRAVGSPRWNEEKNFYQSISTGVHASCPASKLGKDAGSPGGLSSSNYPKYNPDMGRVGKELPEGEVINIMQNEESHNGEGPAVSAADSPLPQYTVETLAIAVVAGSLAALVVGFVSGYLCGRKCHKEEEDNLPYPDTEYEYFEQRQNVNSRMAPEPKLLPQEEVTYAEPVLIPTANKSLASSPKSTLRKTHANAPPAETLFQFADNYTPPPPRDPYAHQRGRDNFGTLRSHQGDSFGTAHRGGGVGGGGHRAGIGDGFGTARSVKKAEGTGETAAKRQRRTGSAAGGRVRGQGTTGGTGRSGGGGHPLAGSSPSPSSSASSPSPPSSSPSPPSSSPSPTLVPVHHALPQSSAPETGPQHAPCSYIYRT
ncbi:hypothetical protein J437_LFUL012909 [Ladona fulva]|uniref:Semaphorin-1A n=1 Tax=Ladona fulva TaxID=123851 RepID=A0A8K0KFJ5_LADFU|nr:hypothetical protein J437_LFUL012909 [Ladona fulva]